MEVKRPRGRPAVAVKPHKRSVSFPPKMHARLETLAERDERSVNDLIKSIVREYLRQHDPNGEGE